MSQKYLDKLEEYEQLAYDGSFGDEWLETVGEGFKFYMRDCVDEGAKPTISGFMKYLNEKAKDSSFDFENDLKRIREKIKNGESSSREHSLVKHS